MSKKRYYISLICLLMLCTTIYGVEIVTTTHVFDEMYKQGQMSVINQNQSILATTETLTYTCTNGAKFYADPYKTFGKISIFMTEPGATVTTTQIDNLKEIDKLLASFAKLKGGEEMEEDRQPGLFPQWIRLEFRSGGFRERRGPGRYWP
jgi:hypothetical protein